MLSSFVICRSVPAILAVADIALRGTLGTNTLNNGYLTAHAAATPDLVQIMHMGTALPLQTTMLQAHGKPVAIFMNAALPGCADRSGCCTYVYLPDLNESLIGCHANSGC